jgi:hypothetical protein
MNENFQHTVYEEKSEMIFLRFVEEIFQHLEKV